MKLSSSQIYNPVGTIIVVTGAVPNGYLACDGSAVNIADYQKLYDVLTGGGNSFPYGANPSATTFLLPNLDERQLVGGTQGSFGHSTGYLKTKACERFSFKKLIFFLTTR